MTKTLEEEKAHDDHVRSGDAFMMVNDGGAEDHVLARCLLSQPDLLQRRSGSTGSQIQTFKLKGLLPENLCFSSWRAPDVPGGFQT